MDARLMIFMAVYGCSQVLATIKLQEHFEWQSIDYEYPSDAARLQAIKTGRFIPENNLPVGIEVWADKLFVTVPRWRPGKTTHYYNLLM